MNRIATFLARRLWAWMLWLMRRPWMKRLQRGSIQMLPPKVRSRVKTRTVQQNRFARRHGQAMLALSLNFLMASVAITFCYQTAIWMLESGKLSVPDEIRARAEQH